MFFGVFFYSDDWYGYIVIIHCIGKERNAIFLVLYGVYSVT